MLTKDHANKRLSFASFLLFFINQNDQLMVSCVLGVSISQIFNVQNFERRENNLFNEKYSEMSLFDFSFNCLVSGTLVF